MCQSEKWHRGSLIAYAHLYDYRVVKGTNPMLKQQLTKAIAETAFERKLTRREKFDVFCHVCDNMLKEGRISTIQHERWTNVF